MLFNYDTFLITEASKTEKLKKKQQVKIKNFFDNPDIWLYFTSLTPKYSVWFANQFKIIVRSLNSYKNLSDKNFKLLLLNKYSKETKDDSLNKSEKEKLQTGFNKDVKLMVKRYNSEIHYIIEWFHSPIREEEINTSDLNMESAWQKSDEWHKSLKASGLVSDESGKILIEFPDGYYWIDLQKKSCRDEADAMGHCGRTNMGDTLLSLRHRKSPHVTVAYDTKERVIFQMKGRNNTKPIAKYHPYIYRLLVDPNINASHIDYEWNSAKDFSIKDLTKKQINKLFEAKPDMIINSQGGTDLLFSLYEDNEISKNDLKKLYMSKKDTSLIEFTMKIVEFYEKKDENSDYFTKDEIKKLIEDQGIDTFDSELTNLILYDKSFISKEQFAKCFSDLYVDDKGELKIRVDEMSELDFFLDDTMQQILDGEYDLEYWDTGAYDLNIKDLFQNLNEKALKEIKTKLVKSNLVFSYQDDENEIDLEEVEFSENNLQMSKNGNILYFTQEDFAIDIEDIIEQNEDDLEGIVRALRETSADTEHSAYYDEIYKQSKNVVEEVLGDWEQIPEKYKDKEGKEATRYFYSFDWDWDILGDNIIEELEDELRYNGEIDYSENSICSSILCLISEFVKIESSGELNTDQWTGGYVSDDDFSDTFIERLDI